MTDNLLEADIPKKFKDPESGQLKLDALLKSYRELERRMSQSPSVPKSPDEYQIDLSHGLFEADPEVNQRLHKYGCTAEQVQEVYNLAAEKLMPMIARMNAEFAADREVEKLINHFGGAEQWREVSRQLLAFGQKNMPPEVLDTMASSFEGVLALQRMMKSDEPGMTRDSAKPNINEERDLQAMMRDPRYWRDKDPSFVAKVTEGFKGMYK